MKIRRGDGNIPPRRHAPEVLIAFLLRHTEATQVFRETILGFECRVGNHRELLVIPFTKGANSS
jgi:hypothetical protein